MSMKVERILPVPEETASVARAAFPKGNRYMRMRDRLGVFFTDEQFAKLVPYDLDTAPRELGVGDWKGEIWIADDFDELPEELHKLFAGE